MSNPSYLAHNPDELFDQAPQDVQELIHGTAVNEATAILGKLYKIPISSYVALSNVISFILIGVLKPEDAVRGIVDLLELSEEDALKLAGDLDKTILEKARISILGKSPKDMVTLSFPDGRSPDELRKEILDTTKREALVEAPLITQSAEGKQVVRQPSLAETKKNFVTGSRSQLLEQLQVLDDIPNDSEIAERLSKIQAQISGMNTSDERNLESSVALQEFMPKENERQVVEAESKSATYSKAPTQYNVDPYREPAGE